MSVSEKTSWIDNVKIFRFSFFFSLNLCCYIFFSFSRRKWLCTFDLQCMNYVSMYFKSDWSRLSFSQSMLRKWLVRKKIWTCENVSISVSEYENSYIIGTKLNSSNPFRLFFQSFNTIERFWIIKQRLNMALKFLGQKKINNVLLLKAIICLLNIQSRKKDTKL